MEHISNTFMFTLFSYYFVQVSAMNNPVHPKLMEQIGKELDIGITSVGIMSRALKAYVQENFPDANPADSRYYPSRMVLSNAMYQMRNRLRYSKIDELNVDHMVSTAC